MHVQAVVVFHLSHSSSILIKRRKRKVRRYKGTCLRGSFPSFTWAGVVYQAHELAKQRGKLPINMSPQGFPPGSATFIMGYRVSMEVRNTDKAKLTELVLLILEYLGQHNKNTTKVFSNTQIFSILFFTMVKKCWSIKRSLFSWVCFQIYAYHTLSSFLKENFYTNIYWLCCIFCDTSGAHIIIY